MAGRFSIEAVFRAVDRISAPVSRMQNRIGQMTRSMTRGLRNANRAVGRVSASLGRGLRNSAIAATAVITGVGVALDGVSSKADALAKQSRRLQFPIKELQEWKFISEQSGVPVALLDSSLGAFSKRLGEAASDTGPLVSGLKKLNPELLKQLIASDSISESFDLYIKAIRNADSATEKAALANAAFSRSGLKLVDISNNSAEAIEKLRKQQQQNGIITMKQAEAAEAYGDAVNALKRTVEGFIQEVLIPMLPMLTELISGFREWAIANKGVVASKIFEFGRNLVDNFQNVVEVVKKVAIGVAIFYAFVVILKTLVLVMTAVNLVMTANPVTLIVLGILALIAAVAAVIYYWDELTDAFMNSGVGMDALVLSIGLLTGPIGLLAAGAALIIKYWSPIKTFFRDLWGGIVSIFDYSIAKIIGLIDRVKSIAGSVVSVLGFGSDSGDGASAGRGPQVISPQARVARSIEEQRTTSSAEVTIRDESGRAEVTGGSLGRGLFLTPSGGF